MGRSVARGDLPTPEEYDKVLNDFACVRAIPEAHAPFASDERRALLRRAGGRRRCSSSTWSTSQSRAWSCPAPKYNPPLPVPSPTKRPRESLCGGVGGCAVACVSEGRHVPICTTAASIANITAAPAAAAAVTAPARIMLVYFQ